MNQQTKVKCCRCRNKHEFGERVDVPSKKWSSAEDSTCPRCGAHTFKVIEQTKEKDT